MTAQQSQAEPIGITMGCPVGIGPEIVLRFCREYRPVPGFFPVVLGDLAVLRRCGRELGLTADLRPWQPGAQPVAGAVHVLPLSELGEDWRWGEPDGRTGRAMGGYVETAVRLIREGKLAAMVTCPIAKHALQAAGYPFPGHTEMLARLCGSDDYAMMMVGDRLRVALVTIHEPLAAVAGLLSQEAVFRMIAMARRALRQDFALAEPSLAVAGLNPHAGEGGLFGDEEARLVAPAVAAARQRGWQVQGPLPPDTVFHQAAAGGFDAVIALYHDQGLIPFKLLHFRDGVNVTVGLPIVRTSVDHGTAYDIAGQGRADAASLRAAYGLAATIVGNRRRRQGGGA